MANAKEAESHVKTGKRIYQLESLVGILKDEALLPISQDNLTRKIQARVLRRFLNGDNDEPSEESYFSSAKVTDLMNDASDRFNSMEDEITAINNRIDNLTNTVNENYHTLDNRITNEVNNLKSMISNSYDELVAADDALRIRCTNLENRCTSIETSIANLNTKLEGWILYGSSPPSASTLPAGRLYIQYF